MLNKFLAYLVHSSDIFHLILLNLITLLGTIISKFWGNSLCNSLSPPISSNLSLSHVQILSYKIFVL